MIYEKYLFTFILDANKKFIITLEDDIALIDPYSSGKIIFHQDSQQYQLYEEFPVNIFLLRLKKLLKQSLYNALPLDQSITCDLGFLWNQKMNDSNFIEIKYTDHNNDTYWIGQKYELACHEYVSWIYNDNQGDIIFEITPTYPQFFDEENKIEVIKYQNWMKSYQPVLLAIVSCQIAQQWIRQIEIILEKINKNMEKIIASR